MRYSKAQLERDLNPRDLIYALRMRAQQPIQDTAPSRRFWYLALIILLLAMFLIGAWASRPSL